MGGSGSKHGENEALLLCRDRVRCIRQAIDSRYALSAAHLSYIQSLRNVGIALRRLVEAELSIEPSLSTSELDKTPTHSSYASPSPSHIAHQVGSPPLSGSPLSPRLSNMSYMRVGGGAAVTVTIDPSHMVDDEDPISFPVPPPPPPLETGSSWDFFDNTDVLENARFRNGEKGSIQNGRFADMRELNEEIAPLIGEEVAKSHKVREELILGKPLVMGNRQSINGANLERSTDLGEARICEERGRKSGSSGVNGSVQDLARIASSELCKLKGEKSEVEQELHAEREDASEFITHRAKDFLSSIRDIEHRFLRAAECGHEISRMLETNKIRLGVFSEIRGKSTAPLCLSALHPVCCKRGPIHDHESSHHVTRVITWNRSTSSVSSSSKVPLTTASKDEVYDSGSDFIEEFCMISGSHSSTLDRLYAWERKLYDEVKASESISKAYDRKCSQLRHQSAKDLNAQVIDKTRAVVKDLHSRLKVAIQAVNSISKRIEKLRDDELQPQLLELIQGLIRMWKAMLECHHAQYITISLAYQVKNSTAPPRGESETHKNVLAHLQDELECFGSSFAYWVDAHKSYVEAIDTWIQKCIMQPQERSRAKRVIFPQRRAPEPPLFVLCRDWLAGMKSLPSRELCDSIKGVVSVLRDTFEQQIEEKNTESKPDELENGESEQKEKNVDEKCNRILRLENLQASLTGLFDRSTKFSEASLKVYEDLKQGNETARIAYANGGVR